MQTRVIAFRMAVVSTPLDDLLGVRRDAGVNPANMRDKEQVVQGALDWLVNELMEKLPEGCKHTLVVAVKEIPPGALKETLDLAEQKKEDGGDDEASDERPGGPRIEIVGG